MDGTDDGEDRAEERLRRHLEASNTRRLLIVSGLFLVAWELVENGVVDGVRGFFAVGFDDGGIIMSEEYQSRVLDRAKYEFDACLGWLLEVGALTEQEAHAARALRTARNHVAHELPAIVVDPTVAIDFDLLDAAYRVLRRLAVFFGTIEVDIDPAFEQGQVDYEAIESGHSLLFAHVLASLVGEHVDRDDAGDVETS